MNLENNLDRLQDELVSYYEMLDDSPQMIAFKVKELVATGWKDEQLKKEVEEEFENQQYCIQMIHDLKQVIEFVKTENPTNEELTKFTEKTIRKDLDSKMKGDSEKSSQDYREKMFSDMDRYSSFEN
ncbi:hypothetical protein [Nitrosopumilus sp. Nsub]|uniref:hypothetical protein n=1 Tax=Nitrosopumilus sp. Nsub TaxID=1776294 RepID=UPI0012E37E9A|nr:hypothetical protein [Nitrosopumilus sp. Nsub]